MAPTTTSLLGPPEIHRPSAVPPSSSTTSDPFMDAMISNFNSIKTAPIPPMGYTENMSATFLSTGNPCLDFFFHIVPDTPPETISRRLQQSWEHDPLTTLKLICNLRGVRGTGKSDKEGYYTSALWLYKHHPKTLACNVASLADFGYFKDLPEILYRLLEGLDVRKRAKKERLTRSSGRRWFRAAPFPCYRGRHANRWAAPFTRGGRHANRWAAPFTRGGRHANSWAAPFKSHRCRHANKSGKKSVPREQRILSEMKRAEIEKLNASKNREEKRIMMAKKAIERYNRDPDYKVLHEKISDLFAELLRSDVKLLTAGESTKISLASKWCPSLDSSFDKSTLLCESIAKKVFPRDEFAEYDGVEEAHYAYRVRDRLRKQVLVPLRKALELPEVYIGQNQWHLIPYNRVASVAMKFYKEKFLKHDKIRFEQHLENVRSGKSTIAAGALLPHEIISSLNDDDGGQVGELQWKRMVDDMLKKGKLNNCLAICDVSGSMSGTPMEVCIALGILVSELSELPWKGKVITFSENPKLNTVQGDDLQSKVEFVRHMDWGMNTNFQKVFDLILEVASNVGLSEEQMIKRVFVFSDMEFDQASVNPWETDYQVIKRKFSERGYGGAVPEMVFWNLRDSSATPVAGKENGVALVSGFSKNLMTLFMEDGEKLNPEGVMESAISGDEYKKLVVVD